MKKEMQKEKINQAVNLKLSKRQNLILKQLASKSGFSKSRLIRELIFGSRFGSKVLADEPSYDSPQQEEDSTRITERLDYINKNILKLIKGCTLAERESILSSLDHINNALKPRN